ncbi:hypothetical protein F320042A7_37980 [Blautia producta]
MDTATEGTVPIQSFAFIAKSMHTDCKSRSLARVCFGIALQMQGSTWRDSGSLNCYEKRTHTGIPGCV